MVQWLLCLQCPHTVLFGNAFDVPLQRTGQILPFPCQGMPRKVLANPNKVSVVLRAPPSSQILHLRQVRYFSAPFAP